MQTSEQINEIATALVAVQSEIEDAEANAVNPAFGSRYSKLPTVMQAIRPTITKHGIAIIQSPASEQIDGVYHVGLMTRLLHTSGQWIEGEAFAPPEETNKATTSIQMFKKAVTMMRRTAALSMVGIAEEEDDDGASSAGQPAVPGQVRSLGTVTATSGPGIVNAVQLAPATADPVATAGEVFDGAGDDDAALGAALRDLAQIGATADEVTAATQKGMDAVVALVRHKHQDVILDELSRLNAKPEEFEAALQRQYGVPTMAGLTVGQMQAAIAELRKLPTPGGIS